jgi:TrmH family RNA methyltransferase
VETITSTHNPKIKNIIKLHKASERKQQQLFLVEGHKEINLALNAGYKIQSIFWCPGLGISKDEIEKIQLSNQFTYEINIEIFSRIAYRERSDGLMAIFNLKQLKVEDLNPDKNSMVIVLESVEKPGNLGAILRTADAASVFAILVCDQKTDIYNPNVVRSSIGCLFTNKVVACSNEEANAWLKKYSFKTYAAALDNDSKSYCELNYSGCVAFIMGTESKGLSEFWMNKSDEKIIIPMSGKIDSLNVSTSTAILVFEAMRQRNFNNPDTLRFRD